MIKIAICDDDTTMVEKNESEVKQCMVELRTAYEITTYFHVDNLIYDVIEEQKYYDLILMDIEMPRMTGMEAAKMLSAKYPMVKIIFVTSHLEYAIDAFELSIFRYVPKEENNTRMQAAIRDAAALLMIEGEQVYQISYQNRYEKIPYRSILYIFREGKNAVIVTLSGETKVRKTLQVVYEEINAEEFLFIDRGMIVNLIHIMKVADGMAYLQNGERLTISRSHLMNVKKVLNLYWGEHV